MLLVYHTLNDPSVTSEFSITCFKFSTRSRVIMSESYLLNYLGSFLFIESLELEKLCALRGFVSFIKQHTTVSMLQLVFRGQTIFLIILTSVLQYLCSSKLRMLLLLFIPFFGGGNLIYLHFYSYVILIFTN